MWICLSAATRMSTTLSMSCNGETSTVFCTGWTMGTSRCMATSCQQPCPRTGPVGLPESSVPSTTCGTGMSAMRSTVRSRTPSTDTVFGNFTNCSTISGTRTSRICSAVPCKIVILGTPTLRSITCGPWTSAICSQIVIMNWPERIKTQPHDDKDNCFQHFDS